MGETLAQKIIRAHLLHGDMTPGSEIALRIDQKLSVERIFSCRRVAGKGNTGS